MVYGYYGAAVGVTVGVAVGWGSGPGCGARGTAVSNNAAGVASSSVPGWIMQSVAASSGVSVPVSTAHFTEAANVGSIVGKGSTSEAAVQAASMTNKAMQAIHFINFTDTSSNFVVELQL